MDNRYLLTKYTMCAQTNIVYKVGSKAHKVNYQIEIMKV